MSDVENTETMGASDDTDEEQAVADDGNGDGFGGAEETGRAEAPKPKPPAAKTDSKEDDPYTPPSADEWRRTQAALKKANEDGKRHRLRNKELEDAARVGETEHEKALREAREQGEKRYRGPLVRTAARSALIEAGALAFMGDEKQAQSPEARTKAETRLTKLLKLIDLDSLDVDEEGTVSGLEVAVDELRRDYAELFTSPAKSKPKPRPTAADRQPAEEKPKSSAERHAMRVLGRTG